MNIEVEVTGRGKAIVELDDRNPMIAKKIYESLPIEGKANIWKEEVYFEIPLKLSDENTSPTAEKGDVSYWSPGNAICIFFGESQPYSPVNHIGKVVEGLELFRDVEEGDKIVLRKK
ncbi:MAG: cyclophilin-like fold protein [Candidatus Methanospirareceae archaeon]